MWLKQEFNFNHIFYEFHKILTNKISNLFNFGKKNDFFDYVLFSPQNCYQKICLHKFRIIHALLIDYK